MIALGLGIFIFCILAGISMRSVRINIKGGNRTLIVFGVLIFIVHISADLLFGGHTPIFPVIQGIILWLIIVTSHLIISVLTILYGISMLFQKDYKNFWIALAVFILSSIPIFLPLPGLFLFF